MQKMTFEIMLKIVFLQSSIIKIFYAHENSFPTNIFLSQVVNQQLKKAHSSATPLFIAVKISICLGFDNLEYHTNKCKIYQTN